jgi:bcr-type benzoyl-CoA reductase subunit C
LAAKGKLDFLDGFLLSDICFEMRHVGDALRYFQRFPIVYIQWPLEVDESRWSDFIVDRLRKTLVKLEDLLGTKITDDALKGSIVLYNVNRRSLRKVYELRKTNPGIISNKELSALVISSMVMPVEESNALLSAIITRLEEIGPFKQNGVTLFLSGHLCHEVKADILDLIEEEVGISVGDDLYTGFRYYSTDIAENGDPLKAFAHRYFSLAVPCPTRVDPKKGWAEYLIQNVRDHEAQGIVMLLAKNCEPQMIAYPYVKAKLEAAGIPHILIQVEHEMVSMEGIRTRIAAFVEMLREGAV